MSFESIVADKRSVDIFFNFFELWFTLEMLTNYAVMEFHPA